jgi:hypothetical protein
VCVCVCVQRVDLETEFVQYKRIRKTSTNQSIA